MWKWAVSVSNPGSKRQLSITDEIIWLSDLWIIQNELRMPFKLQHNSWGSKQDAELQLKFEELKSSKLKEL